MGEGQETADGTHATRTIALGTPSQTLLAQVAGLTLFQGGAEHQALGIRGLLALFLRARGWPRQDSATSHPPGEQRPKPQSDRERVRHHRPSGRGRTLLLWLAAL